MAMFNYSEQEKKTLRKMWVNAGYVFAGFNMVKMEGNGFALTMAPVLDELYKDEQERKEALRRHNGFFNTHAVMFSLIAGITYALERQKMETGAVTDEVIENIKASLMGPTAGIGDAFFFNCLRVIAAGISIGICASGNFLGSILFILIYGVSQSICKYYLTRLGYTLGTGFIDSLYNSGLMTIATKCVSIVGIMMVGAMTATTVSVPLNFTIHVGGTEVIVQDLFNAIYPDILSVVMVLVIMSLIKKGKRPTMIIFSILVIGIIGAALHIF